MFSKYTKKHIKNNRRGFTLLELVVAVFIMSVLTAMTVANFHRGVQSDDLRRAASEMTSILRKAQNFSQIGSQDIPDEMTNTGRFGVHFDLDEPRHYSLFLDFMGEGGAVVVDGQYQSEERLPNSTYDLPQGIIINNLSLENSNNAFDVVFVPPKPTILFNNSTTEDTVAEITLQQSSTSNIKTIKINRLSGQISIE